MYVAYLSSIPGKEGITNHDRLIGGGISGAVATVFCIPLDTVRIYCHIIYSLVWKERLLFVYMVPFLYGYNLQVPFRVLLVMSFATAMRLFYRLFQIPTVN